MRIFALILLSLLPGLALADSFWDHNGSVVRLVAEGNQRFIYYESPRPGIAAQGVRPGTLLFDGRRIGDSYVGTARVFSRYCAQPMAYTMQGYVQGDTVIVLEGQRPVFDNCRQTGALRYESLRFDYLYSDTPPAPVPTASGRIDTVARATERAIDILLGDPYGRTRDQTLAMISGVTRGGACGADTWTVQVNVPAAKQNGGQGISGYLGITSGSGNIACTNLPFLD